MKHNCLEFLHYSHTEDTVVPGDIESKAVFECRVCGKLFTEEDLRSRKVEYTEIKA